MVCLSPAPGGTAPRLYVISTRWLHLTPPPPVEELILPTGHSLTCYLLVQNRYLWHSTGSIDLYMNESGRWQEISDMAIGFVLEEPARVRVLYSMNMFPVHDPGTRGKW